MFKVYVALIQKAEKKSADYGVCFPDFPGCAFAGKSYEEALQNAQEGLLFHIDGMLESNEKIPVATSIDKIMETINDPSITPTIMRIIIPTGKPKRLNISLDSGLAAEIDAFAHSHGYNRSEFLAEAARRMLI